MDLSKIITAIVAAAIAGLGAWTGVRVEVGGMGRDIQYLRDGISRLEQRIERMGDIEKRQSVMEYRMEQVEKRYVPPKP